MSSTMEDIAHEEANENWAWDEVHRHELMPETTGHERRAFRIGFSYGVAFAVERAAGEEEA